MLSQVRKTWQKPGAKNLQVGAEGSKFTPSEIEVSRGSGNISALWSLTLETPTTRPFGL
jgi:hypothetical protein